MESQANQGNTRAVFQKIEELKGLKTCGMDLVKDLNGELIREREKRKNRWKQHFDQLLNARNDRPSSELDSSPVRSITTEDEPTEEEVEKAIKKLKNHKASGVDQIHAEMLKYGGKSALKWIHRVVLCVWRNEEIPDDWKKAIIVPLFKKGDRSCCENWRGISLLSALGKVFSQILLNRLIKATESKLSETQAGFRKGRGCADQIYTLRRIMEMAADKRISLYMCFVDLKASYVSVDRNK